MIRVLVRHADKADGKLLGEFESEQLQQLQRVFEKWHTYANDEKCKFLDCQFVIGDKDSFFEIIVEPYEQRT